MMQRMRARRKKRNTLVLPQPTFQMNTHLRRYTAHYADGAFQNPELLSYTTCAGGRGGGPGL